MVPESDKQGVCISLAYSPTSEDIVASYRPKAEMHGETPISVPSQTQSQMVMGQGIAGSHVQYRRENNDSCFQKSSSVYANVSQIRLPKCGIVDVEDERLFVSGDEASSGLVFQDLPTFSMLQRHSLEGRPIRDIRFATSLNRRLLGCLSGSTLQIFET